MTRTQAMEMADPLPEPLNLIAFVLVEQHHLRILVLLAILDILQIAGRIPELQFVGMERELAQKLVMIKIHLIATVALLLVLSSQIMSVQEAQHQAKTLDQLVLLGILQIVGRIPELQFVEMERELAQKLEMIKILVVVMDEVRLALLNLTTFDLVEQPQPKILDLHVQLDTTRILEKILV